MNDWIYTLYNEEDKSSIVYLPNVIKFKILEMNIEFRFAKFDGN